MNAESSEKEIRDFYRRWSRSIFAFCCLFLGSAERGESATREAFLAYVREASVLSSSTLPVGLLRCALDAMRDGCVLVDPRKSTAGTLEQAILRLPCEQRVVFILRNVLRVDTNSVAAVTGLRLDQVRQLWMQSMLAVREVLPREFFKERTQ